MLKPNTIARILALSAGAIAVLVLAGWATGLEWLRAGKSGWIVMLPWTAVAFICGSVSLCLSIRSASARHTLEYSPSSWWRLERVTALIVALIGIVMIIQRLAGIGFPVSALLFPSALASYPYRPIGVMATNSAVAFVLLGPALLLFSLNKLSTAVQAAASLSLSIAFLALLGHVYETATFYSFYAFDSYAGMAPITTFSFLTLSIGILAATSDTGWPSMLVGPGAGAVLARRLMTASIVLPIILGKFWIGARRADVISRELAVSLFVSSIVIVFILVILWSSKKMRLIDLAREKARADAETARATAVQAQLEAQKANDAKSQFLAVTSHELRTPLNAIRGYSDLLADGIEGPLTAKQQGFVSKIQKSERHLLTLINDILSFTHLETGMLRFTYSAVSPHEVIESALGITQPQAATKGITLEVAFDVPRSSTVSADPERLLQILVNLLSNAIKFTDNGGTASLTYRKTPGSENAAMIDIEVRDSGRGISADMLEYIFKPFVQIDSGLNRNFGGMGLGLSISRTLARAMGGDLTVQSESGRGSSFVVRIPVSQNSAGLVSPVSEVQHGVTELTFETLQGAGLPPRS